MLSFTRHFTFHKVRLILLRNNSILKPNKLKDKENYWNQKRVQKFLDELSVKLNLKTVDDWNLITNKQIKIHGGGSILHNYTMYELRCLGYPKEKEKIKRANKKNGYWENDENIREFLNELKINLNLNTIEDWNSISAKQIEEYGGSGLLKKYSLFDLKSMGNPEGIKFYSKPKLSWNRVENVHNFVKNLKEKLILQTQNDWNSLTKKEVIAHGGGGLLNIYSMNQIKALGHPNGDFIHETNQKEAGYWEKDENIQFFLNKIRKKLNLNTKEDWNLLTQKQIQNNSGTSLLKSFSLLEIKCLGFPDGKSYFINESNKKSVKYWENIDNVLEFLEKLENQFQLKTISDWKRISIKQINSMKCGPFLKLYSKNDLIRLKFPDFKSKNCNTTIKSSQRWLFLQIQKLFPNEEIVEDYFHSEISRISSFPVQFDIFLVQRNIAIEYHGKQHYEDIPDGFAPLEMFQYRDNEKEKLCKKFGIQLIIVPYWWNNKLDSLRDIVSISNFT